MIIDTHSHLNFNAFNIDREKVIKRSLENNIWMINVGTNFETSKKAVEIAQKYEKGVFSSIGLHPINLDTGLVKMKIDESEGSHFEKEFDYQKYKKLSQSKKVIAMGEIGLDYYWKPKTKRKLELFKEKQRTVLCQELELARELNLPVIFHCRMAHPDLIEFLEKNPSIKSKKAVAHSFVGSLDELKKYLGFGYYIGFNGIIYKKIEGVNFEELIKNTPLEKLLIETDCPYLAPPQANKERNEPIFVKYIAQTIAEIKKISLEELAEITTKNAKKLFRI